jgi:uncharacterized RDD family membrane protein YckC
MTDQGQMDQGGGGHLGFEVDYVGFDLEVTKVPWAVSGNGVIEVNGDGLLVKGMKPARWASLGALGVVVLGFVIAFMAKLSVIAIAGVAVGIVMAFVLKPAGTVPVSRQFPWQKIRKLRMRRLGPIARLARKSWQADSPTLWFEVRDGMSWRYVHALPGVEEIEAFSAAVLEHSNQAASVAPLAPIDVDPLDSAPSADRWLRFLARVLDLWLETFLISLVLSAILGWIFPGFLTWASSFYGRLEYGVILVPLALGLDALVYRYLGWTPGKALFGLKVRTAQGEPLGHAQYLKRNLSLWLSGLGLGIPLANLFTMAWQFNRLGEGQQASYDEMNNYSVRMTHTPRSRKALAILVLVALMLFNVVNIAGTTDQQQLAVSDQSDYDTLLQREVDMLSERLPVMANANTRFDAVELTDEAIRYEYTLVTVLESQFDLDLIGPTMRANLQKGTCGGDSIKVLNSGREMIFVYRDNNGEFLAEFTITKSDCQ